MYQARTEVTAGVAVFLAGAYIAIVNPIILSQAGMPFSAVVTATVLVTAVSSIMMGLWAKNPIFVAPGMGLNAYFTFTVVKGMGLSWEIALGLVFWSGVFFLLLSISKVRSYLIKAIPQSLRVGISCGIGLFIAMIGFVNAGIIVDHPATLVSMAGYSETTLVFVLGLVATVILIVRRVPGSLLLGMIITTILAIPIGRWFGDASSINHGVATLVSWNGLVQAPDFSLLFKADLLGSLKFAYIPVMFSFMFTDLFDSLSTFLAVSYSGNLLDDDGQPQHLDRSLTVDAFSTLLAGLVGSSAGTSYIESAVGIEQGGRTGLVAITAGICFLPLLFFSPALSMIPPLATAPVLVLVGASMMKMVKQIDWPDLTESVPVFLAIVLIPMTYSITNGIVWGLLSYTALKLVSGKTGQIPAALWAVDGLLVVSFFFH